MNPLIHEELERERNNLATMRMRDDRDFFSIL